MSYLLILYIISMVSLPLGTYNVVRLRGLSAAVRFQTAVMRSNLNVHYDPFILSRQDGNFM